MIEYLPQALSSLSTALDIGKSLVEIRDSAKIQEAVIKFNSSIIDAQSKIMSSQNEQSSLAAKVDELEKECVRLKNWESERKKYSRKEIAPGVFAYIVNDFVGELQSAHKYCCNCFDSFKKSTLQQAQDHKQNMGSFTTLTCQKGCPRLEFDWYIE